MYDQLIPEPIHDHKFTLGEGPFYRKQTNEFLQVDINEKKIFVFNLNNGSLHSHEFDEKVSCFSTIETRPHLLIVAGHNNLYLYDMNTKKCEAIKENFFDRKRFRFNDGKCDPVGRFYFGSMDIEEKNFESSLWVIDNGKIFKKLDNLCISNGLAWSSDGKTMYFIDSPKKSIVAFDYDVKSGEMSNERVCLDFKDKEYVPDGMCIDADDNLWVATFGGSKVLHINPTSGEILGKIEFPCPNITSCCFGGENLNDLYVTSARINTDTEKFPLAGSTWVIKNMPFKGRESVEYRMNNHK